MNQKKKLTLIKNNGKKIKIFWDSYDKQVNSISILDYIEKNSELIKKKYISLVDEIGFFKLNGQNLYEVFLFDKNFSYWWVTDIYEKSLYKQRSINEILKLIALEEIIKENIIKKIQIEGFSNKIFNSVNQICVKYRILIVGKKNQFIFLKKFFILSIFFSFLNFLRFISKRTTFIKTNISKKNIKNLFCTYFAYIDFKKLKKNLYSSEYWGGFISKENKKFKENHFLHIFFPSKKISYKKAIIALNEINKNTNNKHFFIEEFFSTRIFFKIVKFWIINIFKYLDKKNSIQSHLIKNNSLAWYFLKDDLDENFCGTSSLINIYYFYLFKEFSKLPNKIDKTFFLYENQGWEKSFVFNLKKIPNNKIYGVQHSTIRYWDLRYNINLSSDTNRARLFENFHPDYYVVNGDDSLIKLLNNGYSSKKIVKAEALRYEKVLKKMYSKNQKRKEIPSILVAGDYSNDSNINIASSLNNLDSQFHSKFNFTLKEHPLREMSKLLKFQFKKSLESIDALSNDHQYAIVSNTTSAVVDLYLLGFKLIVIVDKNTVNFCPLKGNKDIIFLYDHNLLSNYLGKLSKISKKEKEKKNFVYYSSNYDLWNSLID